MTTILAKNAAMLITMDDGRREIAGGALFARDGVIEQVGPTSELPSSADLELDMSRHVVLPGLVNTHHHLYQGLISQELMRESSKMARSYGVRLHTHLAESQEDVKYSRETFGMTPGKYAEDVGWIGDDVWHAHCVMLSDNEIEQFSRTQTGIAHCPNSNMRTAAGIAPIRKFLDAGVPTGLGVDGAAANDAGHLLAEARQALLLQRVLGGPDALKAREALEMATRGGAKVLGRDDIGFLAPGMAADFVAFNLDQIGFVGTSADLTASLIFCHPVNVNYSVINGRLVVDQGRLTTIDLPLVMEHHNHISKDLINGTLHVRPWKKI